MLPSEEKIHLLSQVYILEPLSRSEIEALSWRTPDIAVRRGGNFYTPGQPSEMLFILKRGRVRVHKVVDGRDLTIEVVRPGAIFGEMALTTRQPYRAYAEAIVDSEASVLTKADLQDLVSSHPRVCLKLVDYLSEKLRVTEDRLAEVAFKEVTARLAALLLRLVENEGVKTPRGLRISTRYPQWELGSMIGANREAVTVAFDRLRRSGAVELINRQIHVKDLDSLKRATDESS